MELKYIMFDWVGTEYPVIFPIYVTHNSILSKGKPISAGFCRIGENAVVCYGESISLKLKSREEDSAIVRGYIFEQ